MLGVDDDAPAVAIDSGKEENPGRLADGYGGRMVVVIFGVFGALAVVALRLKAPNKKGEDKRLLVATRRFCANGVATPVVA